MKDLWYKNAIVYCLDVETFADGNGDGIGDFKGLAERLPYLAGLGVTCLWLLPFYPTPNRDNGYDISDYYGVDPRLGTLAEFVEFTHEADSLGLRVIVDLVVNHTSVDHPWFQSSRKSADSPYRDWYVWSKEKPPNIEKGVTFPGVQKTVWTRDPVAKMWYLHRFYEHQADLNIVNPEVRREIERVMGLWIQLGASGFRVDAVPFLIEHFGLPEKQAEDPFSYLDEFSDFLSWRKGDAVMLAEANVEPKDAPDYFGGGDRMQLICNFPVNQHLMLSLVRGDSRPLVKAFGELPELPDVCQWVYFLRGHDEIDLGRLSEEERQEVFAACGPEKHMQLYDRGLRRRFAPMMGGNHRRIEMANSLMFSLPGTPFIWYGEEIGMSEDLAQPERNSVRTPMQWSDAPNGGFSTAPRSSLIRPVVSEGPYGYPIVNVLDQQRDPASQLNAIERMIRRRKECPEIGWGEMRVLKSDRHEVFAHCCSWRGRTFLTLHNFSETPCTVTLEKGAMGLAPPIELMSDRDYESIEDPAGPVLVDGYGYRWFRLAEPPGA